MQPQRIEQHQRPQAPTGQAGAAALDDYLETLGLIERLHRLLLDIIKDEFERLGIVEINAVQGLMLFNIADAELTAGELRSRGCYQGSNVSYNLKKLVELGFIHHQRCAADRRAVRVRLTAQGQRIRGCVGDLLARQAGKLDTDAAPGPDLARINRNLRRLQRFWTGQIRYIY